ncbi:MAG: hypothetical protein HYW48_02690 [Deltaproteobacteria bacterium]|nr:hypothetical protein [Deltaproteobacteria bacterium]
MKLLFFLLFFCIYASAPNLQAQSYEAGLNLYLAHDFEGAERAFTQALNRTQAQGEQAKLYKMLGISQYMQGKRLEAAKSFENAKKLQPNIKIEAAEVIDKSVLDFFDSIESPSPTPLLPKEKPKEHPRLTQVIILSNAVEGQVVVDGIHRGKVGDLLTVEPGERTVEVYAVGYESRTAKFNVQAKGLNKFTFRLDRASKPKKEQVDVKVREPEPEKKPEEPSPAPKPEKPERRRQLPEKREIPTAIPSIETQPAWVNFLPLGIGQYMNEKPVWGLVFTASQVAGLGFFTLRTLSADRAVDDLNTSVDERLAQEDTITDPDERNRYAAETDAIFDEENAKISQMRNEALLGLALLGTAYGASILEGFLNPVNKPSWSWQPVWIPNGTFAITMQTKF